MDEMKKIDLLTCPNCGELHWLMLWLAEATEEEHIMCLADFTWWFNIYAGPFGLN